MRHFVSISSFFLLRENACFRESTQKMERDANSFVWDRNRTRVGSSTTDDTKSVHTHPWCSQPTPWMHTRSNTGLWDCRKLLQHPGRWNKMVIGRMCRTEEIHRMCIANLPWRTCFEREALELRPEPTCGHRSSTVHACVPRIYFAIGSGYVSCWHQYRFKPLHGCHVLTHKGASCDRHVHQG